MSKQYALKSNFIIMIIIIFLLPIYSFSQSYKLAIIPFGTKADQDLSSQRDEIFTTLSSLLSKKDTITIISRADIEKEIDISVDYTNESIALLIGEKVQADYVISGNLTKTEEKIAILVNLVDVSGILPMQSYKADIKELEQVIPQITSFAETISGEILNVEIETPLLSDKKDVEKKVKKDSKPDKTKDKKPTPSDIYFTKEPWTSKIINVGILGMTMGDIDNDGKKELVIVTPKKVQTFRLADGKINRVADIHKLRFKCPVGIDVADINGNGFEEIFITALDNYKSVVTSCVLEYDGKNYVMIENNFNSYFRVITTADNKQILFGQKHRRNAPYKGKIYKLNWHTSDRIRKAEEKGKGRKRSKAKRKTTKYLPEKQILPSSNVNVLGLAYGKITDKEQNYIVAYDEYNNINVIDNTGEKIWESREKYSGNTLFYQIDEGTSTDKKRKFLPVRIINNDINGDGINDIIAVKNYEIARNILGTFKFYNKHHIEILTWDGVSLITKYKTGIIYGFVRDFTIGDLDNDGKDELIVAVIKREGKSILAKPKSFIMVYKQ